MTDAKHGPGDLDALERNPPPAPPSPYMTRQEAAEHLRCTTKTIDRRIPPRDPRRKRQGGRVLLLRAAVEALVVDDAAPAAEDTEP